MKGLALSEIYRHSAIATKCQISKILLDWGINNTVEPWSVPHRYKREGGGGRKSGGAQGRAPGQATCEPG